MKITPLDIRHKEFNRSMRGYKDIEVDEFLDDIVEEYERLFNENIDYKERLEGLEDKIQQYKNIEETLQKTLISAQEQAEDLKQNSKKEADLILRDAELKSRGIINDSYAERQKIQRSVQSLKQKHEDLRYQMKSLLEGYLNILDQDEGALPEDYELEESGGAGETMIASAEETEGVEQAISDETMGEEELPGQEGGSGPESEFQSSGGASPQSEEDEEKERVSFPALHADTENKDEEDPFADLEIDTDEKNFKW